MRSWPSITSGKRIRPSWFTGIHDAIDEIDASISGIGSGGLAGQVANMRVGIYNVRDDSYGAVGDGVTDDTVAIQAAIDACGAAGGGIVYFPPGEYLTTLRSVVWSSNRKYRLMVNYDNITLLGAGNRQSVIVSTDTEPNAHCTIAVCGMAKSSPDFTAASMYKYDVNFNTDDYFTFYPFASAPVYSEFEVELDDVADAADFTVGDLVYIRTGNTIDTGAGGDAQPDAEFNRVTGISGAVLSLERPLLKNYPQEYYADATLTGPTTTGSTAYPAVWGIANVEDSTLDGFAAIGLHFECHATHIGNCISTIQVIDPIIRNCTTDTTNMGLQGDGSWRGLVIDGVDVTQNQTVADGSWISADKGCGDFTVLNSRFRNRGTELCYIHMNEGVAGVRIQNTDFINPDVPGSSNTVYSQGGRGYRHALNNVRFQGGGGASLVAFVDVDGAIIDACDLRRTSGTSLSIGSATDATNEVVIGSNQYGRGTVALHHNDATRGAPSVQPQTLMAWVNYDDTTTVIGWLPLYADVLRRTIKRHTIFDGTTPTISLGKSGDTTYLWGAQAMDSVDSNTDDFVLLSINPGFELIATVGGSGAAQGRALVVIEYINGLVPS